jgi:hypothetical protein
MYPTRNRGGEINDMLRQRVEGLVDALHLDFRRDGKDLWVKDHRRADGGNYTSFAIDTRKGMWKDFSENSYARNSGGDLIGLIGEFLFDGVADDRRRNADAYDWAASWVGIDDANSIAPDPKRTAELLRRRREQEQADADRDAHHLRIAHAIFLNAKPLDGSDPASLYLLWRGLDVTKLPGGPPRALRFEPRCLAKPENVELPAMVACMSGPAGDKTMAVHRTYLEFVNGVWRKAWKGVKRDGKPVPAKRVLGKFSGRSIRLTKGVSNRPLATMPKDEWLYLAEGIENALTVALAIPEARVLAAGAASNLGTVWLPEQIGGVCIVADNDTNTTAVKALDRAMDQLAERGIEPAVVRTESGFKDINDMLTGVERDRRNGSENCEPEQGARGSAETGAAEAQQEESGERR